MGIPRAGWGVEPAGNLPATVEHSLLDGLVVDGVCRRLTHLFIGERPLVQVEENERRGQRWDFPGLELPSIFRGKVYRVVVGHGVDQVDLVSSQRGQTHAVFPLGASNQRLEIGQAVAFCISLKVVLEARQLRNVIAVPFDEFEGATADGMQIGLVDAVWRHQRTRIVHHVGRKGGTGCVQVAAHSILVHHFCLLQVLQR